MKWPTKLVAKARLTDQDDLKQFGIMGLKIGELAKYLNLILSDVVVVLSDKISAVWIPLLVGAMASLKVTRQRLPQATA